MCRVPPNRSDEKSAPRSAGRPLSSGRLDDLLGKTRTLRPIGRQPDPQEWGEWWWQARTVPSGVYGDLAKHTKAVWTTCGYPLTALPHLWHLAGRPVDKYPDGTPWTYDDLPGLSYPPAFRLDRLTASGSMCLWGHEVAHQLDAIHGLSLAPGFVHLHSRNVWPDYQKHLDEALAEQLAVYWYGEATGWATGQGEEVKGYCREVCRVHGWVPGDLGPV